MSSLLRVSVVVALAVVLACLPACNRNKSDRIKIGVVTNCTADFWRLAEAGANKAKAEFDVDLDFRQPAEAFDAAVQNAIIEDWLEKGMHGIAVSVIDPVGQAEDITRFAKKVPLVAMDNDAPNTNRLCYIGIDNYEGGKAAGRLVKKVLPNGGTVAIFIGSTKSANGKARVQGVIDALADGQPGKPATRTHGGAVISGTDYGKYFLVDGAAKEDGSPTKAQETANGVLARVKGMNNLCMVGLYAYNPPAILAEAKVLGMANQIKIIGFDEDWDTLKAIAAGEIDATVVQDPFMYGYESVRVLAAKARGRDITPDPIAYRVVTKNGEADKIPGLDVQWLKVDAFEADLRAKIASVSKR